MIFTIGFLLFAASYVSREYMVLVMYHGWARTMSEMVILGSVGLMLYSPLILAWRYLP